MSDERPNRDLQQLLDIVEERTEPTPDGKQDAESNIWTGRRRLRQDGNKGKYPLAPDEVDDAVDELLESGELFGWNGLLAPNTEEHLRAIVANENRADTPRGLLIEKVEEELRQ